MIFHRWIIGLICSVLLLSVPVAVALTHLQHETEPNDAPHQAVPLDLPIEKDILRVLGSLEKQDQDAFLLVVGDEHAGRRFDVELTGRAGALTKLDVFDFTELVDARGDIPEALPSKPTSVFQLETLQGLRPIRADGLLLAPGTYVLGVSHSGGEGTYELQFSQNDNQSIAVIDGAENSIDDPRRLSTRGRSTLFSGGETFGGFEIDAHGDTAGDDPAPVWDLAFQMPAGRDGTLRLENEAGDVLLELDDANGLELRRRGLSLAPGRYLAVTETGEAAVQMITVEAGAPVADGDVEVEPNDRQPNAIAFFQDLSGRFEDDDSDNFTFDVGPEDAGRRFTIQLTATPGSKPEICIKQDSIRLSECNRAGGDGKAGFADVVLAEGRYELVTYLRTDQVADWSLAWTEQGPAKPGEETEPNNDQRLASHLHERGFGRGRFIGRETDWWRFSVEGEPQLWRLQLQGDDLHELNLYSATGQMKRVRPGAANRARLDNVFLLPGDYFLSAEGADSDYTLRAVALGPPPPGMEMEPNDDVPDAMRIRFGQPYTGTLAESDDTDRYAFVLLGEERVRIRVEPPVDGRIEGALVLGDAGTTISELRRAEADGTPLEWDVFLPPGDYGINLSAYTTSDAEYTLAVERGDWLDAVVDREPNGWRATASPFPADGVLHGRVGDSRRNQDWYRLPARSAPVALSLPKLDGVSVQVFPVGSTEELLDWNRETERFEGQLAPDTGHDLRFEGKGEYALDLSMLADAPSEVGRFADVTLHVEPRTIQAFSRWAQRLEGTLRLRNPQSQDVSLDLRTHLTDARWVLALDRPAPERLDAGAQIELPFTIGIPPDVPDWVSVQLSTSTGAHATAGRAVTDLSIAVDASPVRPTFYWPVPEALRGGFNAAASSFGAEPVASPGLTEDQVEDMGTLFDSLAQIGNWTEYKVPFNRGSEVSPGQPTVRLAGDAPVPVRGFLLNPTASLSPATFLHDFAVELSSDGETFERVLEATLQPIPEEQAFALPEPVEARFARLIPLGTAFSAASNWGIRVGEFKVVAEPGWRPLGGPVNVADPERGGHLVWGRPWIRGSTSDRSMLIEDGEAVHLNLRQGGHEDGEIVLGFHHSRAALIDAISMLRLADAPPDEQPARVAVSVSQISPIGPWTPIAEQDLVGDETRLDLDSPVWARYVRFHFSGQESARLLRMPDRIAIFEHAVQADDPSILGEWGHYSWRGPFEAAETPQFAGLAGEPEHASREAALPLVADVPAPGRALLDTYASWYRIEMPEDMNRLVLRMQGVPTLEAAPRLIDATGEPVASYPLAREADGHRWEAYLEPGQVVYLEAYEPPRSVIFSWDTSGSVARYLPIISNALFNYAQTIVPGRDEVNLLPFGHRSPLLTDWVGHPYPLQRLLAAYPQDTSSSDAEGTLAAAARTLTDRPGKKAVILLTDAATSTDASLWPSLEAGEPQIFSMALSTEGALSGSPNTAQDYMQDWAMVRGGEYQYVTSLAVLQMGFDRAVARLKAPVDFEVEVGFEAVEDPEPATIAVVGMSAAEDGAEGIDAAARGAVEIILDASGSMLQRMGGERRIEIAKAAIRRTVEDTLPGGIPLALRVYGHREAGVCRTDLEIPLQPLDKAAFLQRVDEIQAVNLARTPIAESLEAVASDLDGAEGRRLVILLTDGEETCDGAPAAAIQGLIDSGVDVRINIVGFAIDDQDLKQQFSDWAGLGGGEYLDAGEAGELEAAMRQALRIPFRIEDSTGKTVGDGFVGDQPVEVPPGGYRVIVERADGDVVENVNVVPGDTLEIEID
ncbi:MAG TPA: VWA domain-containing protein [Wenzhouxiangellaceae bacterium]|nr:VWA domain-containing protein [Wenzhouxiangellaceae bacterium]